MARDTGGALDVGQVLGRHPFPQGNSLSGFPDLARHPGHKAAFFAEKCHAGVVHTQCQAQLDGNRQVFLDGEPCSFPGVSLGDRIRRERTKRRMSLRDVAEAIGLSRNAVHLWEVGDTTKMKLANRIALSELFDIPLVDLLPPEAAGKDMTIRDSEEIFVIERFRIAQPQQRELFVRLLAEMTEGQTRKD
jgi:transcriptional regulator with XRE-family HTH domain